MRSACRWASAGRLQSRSTTRHSFPLSPIEPVRHLDQERIRGMYPEQPIEISRQRTRSLERLEVLPALGPYQIERRPGAVFPPQHGARVERLEVEGAGI